MAHYLLRRRIVYATIGLLGLGLSAMPALASYSYTQGTATEIIDGLSFTLKDGQTVLLAGLSIPALQDRKGNDYAIKAKDYLWQAIKGKQVDLKPIEEATDRHGRLVAEVSVNGKSIQEALLSKGFAMVYVLKDEPELSLKLMEIEAEARKAHKGLWAEKALSPIAAENAGTRLYNEVLVEGMVTEVSHVRGVTYLNFGKNWRSDFTAKVDTRDAKAFKAMNLDALKGRKLRIRGYLSEENGPMIWLYSPVQIELLGSRSSVE